MARCAKCNEFFPPDFTEEVGNNKICVFCSKEISYITYKPQNENVKRVTKQEIVNEYKQMLSELSEKKNVKSFIAKGVPSNGFSQTKSL